jgi:pSer/pThr/pTyr-binding forkhead associated (FHA) protein
MPKIIVKLPDGRMGEYRLGKQRRVVRIGREKSNQIQIGDKKASREHAEICLTDEGDYVLGDLQSRNGTSHNGTRLTEPQKLTLGDTFRIGDIVFMFADESITSEAALSTLNAAPAPAKTPVPTRTPAPTKTPPPIKVDDGGTDDGGSEDVENTEKAEADGMSEDTEVTIDADKAEVVEVAEDVATAEDVEDAEDIKVADAPGGDSASGDAEAENVEKSGDAESSDDADEHSS